MPNESVVASNVSSITNFLREVRQRSAAFVRFIRGVQPCFGIVGQQIDSIQYVHYGLHMRELFNVRSVRRQRWGGIARAQQPAIALRGSRP
jgi:hypothetical protein